MKFPILFALPFLLAGCGSNSASSNAQQSVASSPSSTSGAVSSSNTLVAYFSVTKHTKGIASYAQEHLGCDLFEIVPKQEYTSADIDYQSDCRANREQNDPSARPEILNPISDFSSYDTIVLGYPIWRAQAPKILYTFLESYDFTGKVILPFCTSGSSPIGNSAINLAKSAPTARWLEGKRFSASDSKEEVASWLDQSLQEENIMTLTISGKPIDVTWEQNDSVTALSRLKPLEVSMSRFGGFEQVGPLGHTLPSHDVNLTTGPGDIVLYSSNQIVVFFGSNTWAYTKLGHIAMSQEELTALLNHPNVMLNIR